MLRTEGVNFCVVKFATIVALKSKDGEIELGACIGMKSSKCRINIRLAAKRKTPKEVTKIIHDNQII